MTERVADYQQQLLKDGYRYLYLCEDIDSEDWGHRRYYQAVIPGDQPLAPCMNDCPIEIMSDVGLKILEDYINTDLVDISFV